MENHFSS